MLAWADGLDPEAVAITAMTEAEILHGLARLPDGRRKQNLQQSWDALMAGVLTGRVWPFTSEAAHWYAQLLRRCEQLAHQSLGYPMIPTHPMNQGVEPLPASWPTRCSR